MKISLAVIAMSGCLIGIIDALRCYDCKDRTEADQGSPDDKSVYGICREEGQADCEEGEVCVSLFFEGYADDPDDKFIFNDIARSCGPANPEQTIDEICQDYADWGPSHTWSQTTCKRETCETELCNTHGNENLQGPVAGEDGVGDGGEGGAGDGGQGGVGDGGEGGAGDGGEGGVDDDTQGGDAQYSSGITHTVSALLAATTALCY